MAVRYTGIVTGPSWHPAEGPDVPWASAPLMRRVDFPASPEVRARFIEPDGVRLTESTRGVHAGQRDGTLHRLMVDPGPPKLLMSLGLGPLTLLGGFAATAQAADLTHDPAARWSAVPYRPWEPGVDTQHATAAQRHAEVRAWDRVEAAGSMPPHLADVTHAQIAGLDAPFPGLRTMQRALAGPSALYMKSPYMSPARQVHHLKTELTRRLGERTDPNWGDGQINHVLRLRDLYLEDPMGAVGDAVANNHLDRFHSLLGDLAVDLSQCVYNWTQSFAHESLVADSTYLWYANHNLQATAYVHRAVEVRVRGRVDLGRSTGRRLLLVCLSETAPRFVEVTQRYFCPSWGETRARPGRVPARVEPGVWLLLKRNLFRRDEVPRNIVRTARRDIGSVRLKIVRKLIWE